MSVVLLAAEEFNTKSAATAMDKNLSPQGRIAGLRRDANEALAKLSEFESKTITPLAERATSIEKALLGKVTLTPPTDRERSRFVQTRQNRAF